MGELRYRVQSGGVITEETRPDGRIEVVKVSEPLPVREAFDGPNVGSRRIVEEEMWVDQMARRLIFDLGKAR